MKKTTKFFITVLLLGIYSLGYSQDVKVNINNQDATAKDDCPYRINGICATEDIGGVNVDFIQEGDRWPYSFYIVLTNYNGFPVNVLWQIEYTGDYQACDYYNNNIKTGNVVIGATGEKKISLDSDCYLQWTLKGLIVRKLAQ
ncbi:MAG: hypothetical protein J6X98_03090 [Bacteroidales bacterium]|nr:hypothetical protein [Bacteroidales bacterium]